MNIIYQLNSILWSLINIIPMPFRMFVGIFIFLYLIQLIAVYVFPFIVRTASQILYWATEILSSIVLFPDYLLASRKRQKGKVAIGAYSHFAGLFEGLVEYTHSLSIKTKKVDVRKKLSAKAGKYIKYARIAFLCYFFIVWITYPKIKNAETKVFAGKTLATWCSFEDFNLNRKWTPISESEKHINEKIYKPAPAEQKAQQPKK